MLIQEHQPASACHIGHYQRGQIEIDGHTYRQTVLLDGSGSVQTVNLASAAELQAADLARAAASEPAPSCCCKAKAAACGHGCGRNAAGKMAQNFQVASATGYLKMWIYSELKSGTRRQAAGSTRVTARQADALAFRC